MLLSKSPTALRAATDECSTTAGRCLWSGDYHCYVIGRKRPHARESCSSVIDSLRARARARQGFAPFLQWRCMGNWRSGTVRPFPAGFGGFWRVPSHDFGPGGLSHSRLTFTKHQCELYVSHSRELTFSYPQRNVKQRTSSLMGCQRYSQWRQRVAERRYGQPTLRRQRSRPMAGGSRPLLPRLCCRNFSSSRQRPT